MHSDCSELQTERKMRHRNIPIFIPHLGCPHQCVFCNQHSISGCDAFREENVEAEIRTALSGIPLEDETEIAFFGGSFTGIPRDLMCRLLETAERFVRTGRVSSIRLSTRPDYITPEILRILSAYSVRHIELGLQSMDDEVLLRSRRGHTAKTAEDACRAVVEAGFSLTGQMMIGLPASTPEKERATAQRIAELGAGSARIYPTVVFSGTPLGRMTEEGTYQPLNLEEAVNRSADALEILEGNGVPCIRIGLCATEALNNPEKVLAGPNHPALGEYVRSEVCCRTLCRQAEREELSGKTVRLHCAPTAVSVAVGQHRRNPERLFRQYGITVSGIVCGEDVREPYLSLT